MSMTREDAEQEEHYARLFNEIGPEWAGEHYSELYESAVKEFTAGRLKSYYVAHPHLTQPAHRALSTAQSFMETHPEAALVFATTAVELTIKLVLLKPIVFGLVHTEALASVITDFATQHTGVDRFQDLLTQLLQHFGGVDLKTFKRSTSSKTLWKEVEEIQRSRNGVVHRGEIPDRSLAEQAITMATTLLGEIVPDVLRNLGLHLHEPGVICDKRHTIGLAVMFYTLTEPRGVQCTVDLEAPSFDLADPPQTVSGAVITYIDNVDLVALRSAFPNAYMQPVSVALKYQVQFEEDSTKFTATKVPWD